MRIKLEWQRVMDEGWMMNDEGWRAKSELSMKDERMNDEGWSGRKKCECRWRMEDKVRMMKDNGWMMKDKVWMMKDNSVNDEG